MSARRFKIVLAKLVDDVELTGEAYRADLGARPKTRDVKRAVALMWKMRGSEDDIVRARAWAPTEDYTVFVYPTAERDPLGRAKREVAL